MPGTIVKRIKSPSNSPERIAPVPRPISPPNMQPSLVSAGKIVKANSGLIALWKWTLSANIGQAEAYLHLNIESKQAESVLNELFPQPSISCYDYGVSNMFSPEEFQAVLVNRIYRERHRWHSSVKHAYIRGLMNWIRQLHANSQRLKTARHDYIKHKQIFTEKRAKLDKAKEIQAALAEEKKSLNQIASKPFLPFGKNRQTSKHVLCKRTVKTPRASNKKEALSDYWEHSQFKLKMLEGLWDKHLQKCVLSGLMLHAIAKKRRKQFVYEARSKANRILQHYLLASWVNHTRVSGEKREAQTIVRSHILKIKAAFVLKALKNYSQRKTRTSDRVGKVTEITKSRKLKRLFFGWKKQILHGRRKALGNHMAAFWRNHRVQAQVLGEMRIQVILAASLKRRFKTLAQGHEDTFSKTQVIQAQKAHLSEIFEDILGHVQAYKAEFEVAVAAHDRLDYHMQSAEFHKNIRLSSIERKRPVKTLSSRGSLVDSEMINIHQIYAMTKNQTIPRELLSPKEEAIEVTYSELLPNSEVKLAVGLSLNDLENAIASTTADLMHLRYSVKEVPYEPSMFDYSMPVEKLLLKKLELKRKKSLFAKWREAFLDRTLTSYAVTYRIAIVAKNCLKSLAYAGIQSQFAIEEADKFQDFQLLKKATAGWKFAAFNLTAHSMVKADQFFTNVYLQKWIAFMRSRESTIKTQLSALQHYEGTLLTKAFDALKKVTSMSNDLKESSAKFGIGRFYRHWRSLVLKRGLLRRFFERIKDATDRKHKAEFKVLVKTLKDWRTVAYSAKQVQHERVAMLTAENLYKSKLEVKVFIAWKLATKLHKGLEVLSKFQAGKATQYTKQAWSRLARKPKDIDLKQLEDEIVRRFRSRCVIRAWAKCWQKKAPLPKGKPIHVKKQDYKFSKVMEFEARLAAKYRRRALKSFFVILIENVIQSKKSSKSIANTLIKRKAIRSKSLAFHHWIAYLCSTRRKRRAIALAEAHYVRRAKLNLLSLAFNTWNMWMDKKLKLRKSCEYFKSARNSLQVAKTFKLWRSITPKYTVSMGSLYKDSDSNRWSGSMKSSERVRFKLDEDVGDWLEAVRREERRRRDQIERELSSLQSSLRASAL